MNIKDKAKEFAIKAHKGQIRKSDKEKPMIIHPINTANTSLEKRTFLNENNINEYNNFLMNINNLGDKENINFYLFDTTNKSERDISFEVLDKILANMRSKYINMLNDEFNK